MFRASLLSALLITSAILVSAENPLHKPIYDGLVENPGATGLIQKLGAASRQQGSEEEKAKAVAVYVIANLYVGDSARAKSAKAHFLKTFPDSSYAEYLKPESLGLKCEACEATGVDGSECLSCGGVGKCKACAGLGVKSFTGITGEISERKCGKCRGLGFCAECKGKGALGKRCAKCDGRGLRITKASLRSIYMTLLRGEEKEMIVQDQATREAQLKAVQDAERAVAERKKKLGFRTFQGKVFSVVEGKGILLKLGTGTEVFLWLKDTSGYAVNDVVRKDVYAAAIYRYAAEDGREKMARGYSLEEPAGP